MNHSRIYILSRLNPKKPQLVYNREKDMLDNIRIKAQKRLSEISTSVASPNFNPFNNFVPNEDIPPAHTIKSIYQYYLV